MGALIGYLGSTYFEPSVVSPIEPDLSRGTLR